MKHIALLRGINVSGQKIIKMADLQKHIAELGFKNISTYIQSGNIIFETDLENTSILAELISNKIKEKYDFDVPTVIVDIAELQYIVSSNPFINNRNESIENIYVAYFDSVPDKSLIAKFKEINFKNEECIFDGKVAYLFYPEKYSNSKLTNNLLESKLKVKATTRNWKTSVKLLELGTSL